MPTAKTKLVGFRYHGPNDFVTMNHMIEVASL